MDRLIEELQSQPLNGSDMMKLVEHKANLSTINSLANYNDINDVLGRDGAVILLYETKPMYGHWVCLYRINNNTLFFFDPYGLAPDQQLRFSKFSKPYLSKLLKKSGYNVKYNSYDIQHFSKNISTCGKFVAFRLIFRNVSNRDFISLFLNNKYYSPDFWISALMTFL
jgi:hypothetical protein